MEGGTKLNRLEKLARKEERAWKAKVEEMDRETGEVSVQLKGDWWKSERKIMKALDR